MPLTPLTTPLLPSLQTLRNGLTSYISTPISSFHDLFISTHSSIQEIAPKRDYVSMINMFELESIASFDQRAKIFTSSRQNATFQYYALYLRWLTQIPSLYHQHDTPLNPLDPPSTLLHSLVNILWTLISYLLPILTRHGVAISKKLIDITYLVLFRYFLSNPFFTNSTLQHSIFSAFINVLQGTLPRQAEFSIFWCQFNFTQLLPSLLITILSPLSDQPLVNHSKSFSQSSAIPFVEIDQIQALPPIKLHALTKSLYLYLKSIRYVFSHTSKLLLYQQYQSLVITAFITVRLLLVFISTSTLLSKLQISTIPPPPQYPQYVFNPQNIAVECIRTLISIIRHPYLTSSTSPLKQRNLISLIFGSNNIFPQYQFDDIISYQLTSLTTTDPPNVPLFTFELIQLAMLHIQSTSKHYQLPFTLIGLLTQLPFDCGKKTISVQYLNLLFEYLLVYNVNVDNDDNKENFNDVNKNDTSLDFTHDERLIAESFELDQDTLHELLLSFSDLIPTTCPRASNLKHHRFAHTKLKQPMILDTISPAAMQNWINHNFFAFSQYLILYQYISRHTFLSLTYPPLNDNLPDLYSTHMNPTLLTQYRKYIRTMTDPSDHNDYRERDENKYLADPRCFPYTLDPLLDLQIETITEFIASMFTTVQNVYIRTNFDIEQYQVDIQNRQLLSLPPQQPSTPFYTKREFGEQYPHYISSHIHLLFHHIIHSNFPYYLRLMISMFNFNRFDSFSPAFEIQTRNTFVMNILHYLELLHTYLFKPVHLINTASLESKMNFDVAYIHALHETLPKQTMKHITTPLLGEYPRQHTIFHLYLPFIRNSTPYPLDTSLNIPHHNSEMTSFIPFDSNFTSRSSSQHHPFYSTRPPSSSSNDMPFSFTNPNMNISTPTSNVESDFQYLIFEDQSVDILDQKPQQYEYSKENEHGPEQQPDPSMVQWELETFCNSNYLQHFYHFYTDPTYPLLTYTKQLPPLLNKQLIFVYIESLLNIIQGFVGMGFESRNSNNLSRNTNHRIRAAKPSGFQWLEPIELSGLDPNTIASQVILSNTSQFVSFYSPYEEELSGTEFYSDHVFDPYHFATVRTSLTNPICAQLDNNYNDIGLGEQIDEPPSKDKGYTSSSGMDNDQEKLKLSIPTFEQTIPFCLEGSGMVTQHCIELFIDLLLSPYNQLVQSIQFSHEPEAMIIPQFTSLDDLDLLSPTLFQTKTISDLVQCHTSEIHRIDSVFGSTTPLPKQHPSSKRLSHCGEIYLPDPHHLHYGFFSTLSSSEIDLLHNAYATHNLFDLSYSTPSTSSTSPYPPTTNYGYDSYNLYMDQLTDFVPVLGGNRIHFPILTTPNEFMHIDPINTLNGLTIGHIHSLKQTITTNEFIPMFDSLTDTKVSKNIAYDHIVSVADKLVKSSSLQLSNQPSQSESESDSNSDEEH